MILELLLFKIQTRTILDNSIISFHLVDNFRKNLPDPFNTMKPELIYQHFINSVQGKVQVKKGIL